MSFAADAKHEHLAGTCDGRDVRHAADVGGRRLGGTVFLGHEPLQRCVVDELENVPRAERLAGDRSQLAALLRCGGGPALKDNLGDVPSFEVSKEFLKPLHDSNDRGKIRCDPNHSLPWAHTIATYMEIALEIEQIRLVDSPPDALLAFVYRHFGFNPCP